MEVTNTFVTTPTRYRSPFSEAASSAENTLLSAHTTRKSEINIENLLMDIEDIKGLLYMMMRGKTVEIVSDTDRIGCNVNKLA